VDGSDEVPMASVVKLPEVDRSSVVAFNGRSLVDISMVVAFSDSALVDKAAIVVALRPGDDSNTVDESSLVALTVDSVLIPALVVSFNGDRDSLTEVPVTRPVLDSLPSAVVPVTKPVVDSLPGASDVNSVDTETTV